MFIAPLRGLIYMHSFRWVSPIADVLRRFKASGRNSPGRTDATHKVVSGVSSRHEDSILVPRRVKRGFILIVTPTSPAQGGLFSHMPWAVLRPDRGRLRGGNFCNFLCPCRVSRFLRFFTVPCFCLSGIEDSAALNC